MVTLADLNTKEIGMDIAEKVVEMTGRIPHTVICNMKRNKVDVNREANQAAQGNSLARKVIK